MKKMNKKVMVLGGLVMAVVLTGYSVVGTYAKYTESAESTATATVAKWDVTLSAGASKPLFDTTNNNALVNDRVAPGGHDSAVWILEGNSRSEVKVAFGVSMKAENTVETEITEEQYNALVAAFGENKITRTADGKYYYAPVVFTVNGETTNYMANKEITVNDGDRINVSWNWAWDAKELLGLAADAEIPADKADVAQLVDELDTKLGKEAETAGKVQVYASIVATQVALDRNGSSLTQPSATDIISFEKNWGYDPTYTAGVTYTLPTAEADGTLTGNIKQNLDETIVGKFAENDAKGYYYPIVLKGEKGTKVKVNINNTKEFTFGEDGSLEILMALDPEAATKKITVEMNGTTTYIDYSGLTFVEAE